MGKQVAVQDRAPDFEAESTRDTIRLTDFLGKKNVLLAFYFKNFTGGWTSEMGAFQKDIDSFQRLDTQVLGVSKDSLESHYKFAEELNLTFPLISDTEGKLSALYASGRITFLIDKKGFVQMIVEGMPDNKKILDRIEELDQ